MPEITMPVTVTTIPTTTPMEAAANANATAQAARPGWQTSEFALTAIVNILGITLTTGLVADGTIWARLIGAGLALLSTFGYTYGRSAVKAATNKASVLVLLVLLGGVGLTQPGCGPAAPVVSAGGAIVIDCVSQDRAQIAALVAAMWNAVANGASWTMVEQQAIANGETLGGCALAEVVQKYLAPPAGRAAPPPEASQAARAALEDFRSKHARGATFHTPDGEL